MENVNFGDCNDSESHVSSLSFPRKQETVCNFSITVQPRLGVKAHFQVTVLVRSWFGSLGFKEDIAVNFPATLELQLAAGNWAVAALWLAERSLRGFLFSVQE